MNKVEVLTTVFAILLNVFMGLRFYFHLPCNLKNGFEFFILVATVFSGAILLDAIVRYLK